MAQRRRLAADLGMGTKRSQPVYRARLVRGIHVAAGSRLERRPVLVTRHARDRGPATLRSPHQKGVPLKRDTPLGLSMVSG